MENKWSQTQGDRAIYRQPAESTKTQNFYILAPETKTLLSSTTLTIHFGVHPLQKAAKNTVKLTLLSSLG